MSTAIAKNFQVGSDSTATNNFTIRQPATPDGTVRIANGNSGTTTDLVTVTSAGNVGVGVTPSAWNSAVRAIELLSPGSAIYGLSGGTTVTAGAYIDSVGWKYSVSGVPITRYDQGAFASGQHTWFNAASGTAGNAISWTQAMTLTAGGNLGVGTTSPSEKLHVVSTTTTQGIRVSGSVDNVAINLSNSGTSGKTWGIYSANSGSGAGGGSLGFFDGTAYRAIIDTNGRFLVGTTTAADSNAMLNVYNPNATSAQIVLQNTTTGVGSNGSRLLATGNDLYITNKENGFMAFETNDTERARITSGGLFFVGVTAQQGGGSHCIQAGTGVNSLQMQNNGATPYGPYINFSAAAPNNASQYFIYCADTAATRMVLYANGGLANYQANNSNLSDRREKTNFAPAKDYLDTICAIPVQTFNYIDQSEDDPGTTLGVVAQDVQAVAPELVMESNWGTKEDPKMRLSIYQTDLQYALMKCIQELKAELDSVKTELALLKGTA